MLTGSLEAVSNREDWTDTITLTDENGDAIDITSASFAIAVRDQKTKCVLLSGVVGSGLTISDGTNGVLTISFSNTSMRGLCAGSYDVGLTMTLSDVTTQLLAGTLPVVDGVVV